VNGGCGAILALEVGGEFIEGEHIEIIAVCKPLMFCQTGNMIMPPKNSWRCGMLLNDAIQLFIKEREAARYSPNTIRDYHVTFNKLLDSVKEDVDLADITRTDIVAFLNVQTGVSAKTLRNYHADLSALWQWAVEQGLCNENIIRSIRAPVAEKKDIFPFEKAEVLALINAAERSENSVIALRNQAIIYLLLDCGIRASELCGLRVRDVNEITRHIIVFGKRKERAKSTGFKIDVGKIGFLSKCSAAEK